MDELLEILEELKKHDIKESITEVLLLGVFENKQFEDVAYFEPFYLKDFVAAKPSVKGLTIQK